MSKELEAFERFRNNAKFDNQSDYYLSTKYIDDSDIVETALKDYEKIKKEFDDMFYISRNSIKIMRKLKALEIIKNKLDANTICRVFGHKGYEIIEYFTNDDLLKEKLK